MGQLPRYVNYDPSRDIKAGRRGMLTNPFAGLEKNQYHENAKKYLKGGYGGVLSFGPKGGDVASKMLLNYVKVISHQTK